MQKNTIVKNPYYSNDPLLFIGMNYGEKIPFESLLKASIDSKESKKHHEKENTVIIIDNRTISYEYDDLREATNLLRDYYQNSTFKEIWFYTGYGSNFDGNNAEFSLVPLKITEDHKEKILNKVKENSPDDNSLIFLLF